MEDKDYIKALEKALKIICLLSQHGSPLNLENLVRISGVKKTSCFRILQTLVRSGFVAREPDTNGYFIGPKMISIGLAAMDRGGVRELALPFMKELREKTGTTVNLGVLSGTEVIFVERLQSPYILEPSLRVGSRLSVHCSSLGKAILAQLPESEVEELLKQIHFERKTEKTIMSVRALKAELKTIRERGFALNDEELEPGLFAISAALRNHTGAAVAAMNMAFPLMRHSKEKAMTSFLPLLLDICGKISSVMGFREK